MKQVGTKQVLVFLLAIPLLVLAAQAGYALCCDGVAYHYGVCYEEQFYEGCQFMQADGSLVVYEPGTIIDPCLKCECTTTDICNIQTWTANIHCQWQPQHSLCDVCHRCTMEWLDGVNRECSRDQFGFDDPTNALGIEYYHPLSGNDPADIAPNGSNCNAYVGTAYPEYFAEFNRTESCGPHNATPDGTELTYVCGWDLSATPYCTYGNPDENYPSIPYVRVSANIGPGGTSNPMYACHEACFSQNEDGDNKDYVYGGSSCSLINQTWCNGTISGVAQFLDRDYNSTVCTDSTGCTDYAWLYEGMADSDPGYMFDGYGDGLNWDGDPVNYPPVGCFPYLASCTECCGDDTDEVDVSSYYCEGTDGRSRACCKSPMSGADTCAWNYNEDYFCTPKASGENQEFNLLSGSVLTGCGDKIDNDCDGLIDGADPDCFGCSAGTLGCSMPCPDCYLGEGNCDLRDCLTPDTCSGSRDQCVSGASCPSGYEAGVDASSCDLSACGDQAGICCRPVVVTCPTAEDVCAPSCTGCYEQDDSNACTLNGGGAGMCCKLKPGECDACEEGICLASCTETCPINYTGSSGDTSSCDLNVAGDQAGVCCMKVPECYDGCDNDANGCRDYPTDTGCFFGTDDSEAGGTCRCTQNGVCELGESCDCSDCAGLQDSCMDTLVCDLFRQRCECPIETYMLYNGTCGSMPVPYEDCNYNTRCSAGAGEDLLNCEDCATQPRELPAVPPPEDPYCNFNGTCELWNETGGFEWCSCSDCKFFTNHCMPKTCVDNGICEPTETCECDDCNRQARCTAQCNDDGDCDAWESCTCLDCDHLPIGNCISGTLCEGLNCTCLPQLEECWDGTCRTDCDKNPYIYEVFCYDGIDNDGDEFTDFQDPAHFPETDSLGTDPDCTAIINGTVWNITGQPLPDATVHVIGGLFYWGRSYTYAYNVSTNSSGRYSVRVNGGTTYDVTITFPNHSPGVNMSVYMDFFGVRELNYTLRKETSTCNAECTRGTSNVCDATCHGWNNCMFPSQAVMDICDPAGPDAHTTEHTVAYSPTNEVRCCTGTPQPKVTLRAAVLNVTSENVVVTKRIVILNGKPVTMHVAVFD